MKETLKRARQTPFERQLEQALQRLRTERAAIKGSTLDHVTHSLILGGRSITIRFGN